MSQIDSPAKRWAAWLSAALAERNWQQRDLIAASNNQLRSGTLSKWINGQGPATAVWAVRVARWLGADEAEALRAAGRDEILSPSDQADGQHESPPESRSGAERPASRYADDDDDEFIAKLRASSDPKMHELADRFEADLERVRRLTRVEYNEIQRQRATSDDETTEANTSVNKTA